MQQVISGMDVVRKVQKNPTLGDEKPEIAWYRYDEPIKEVKIADCGAEVVHEPFNVSKEDAVDMKLEL